MKHSSLREPTFLLPHGLHNYLGRHPSERMHGRVKIQIFGHTFSMESLAGAHEGGRGSFEELVHLWFFIFFLACNPDEGFFLFPISVVDGRKGPSFHTGITLASPTPPPPLSTHLHWLRDYPQHSNTLRVGFIMERRGRGAKPPSHLQPFPSSTVQIADEAPIQCKPTRITRI